jgi:hypothetical protein
MSAKTTRRSTSHIRGREKKQTPTPGAAPGLRPPRRRSGRKRAGKLSYSPASSHVAGISAISAMTAARARLHDPVPGAATPDRAATGSAAPRLTTLLPARHAARVPVHPVSSRSSPTRLGGGHLVDEITNEEGAKGSPIPRRLAIMGHLHRASRPSLTAGQRLMVKVPGQRTREDGLDSLLQLPYLAPVREWRRPGEPARQTRWQWLTVPAAYPIERFIRLH